MEYLFQPIFKYICLILMIFMFLIQYKTINQDSYLSLSIVIIIFVIILDFFYIHKHPNVFEDEEEILD